METASSPDNEPRFGDRNDPNYQQRVDTSTDEIMRRSGFRLTTNEAREHAISSEHFAGDVQQRIAQLRAENTPES